MDFQTAARRNWWDEMNIADLKGQIAVLEQEQRQAMQTYQQTIGALKLARHLLEKMEAEAKKDAPTIVT